VRTGWLFGGWPDDHKFVGKLLKQARSADRILAVNDKYGSPTYTTDLADGLLRLLELGLPGTYHVVNIGEPATRYEVACRVVEFSGLNCKVEPIGSERFALAASRPTMEAVRNFRLELMGQMWMRSWQAALRAYITQIMTS
jgi:dTDP-4-dehydrorhamnose reductase